MSEICRSEYTTYYLQDSEKASLFMVTSHEETDRSISIHVNESELSFCIQINAKQAIDLGHRLIEAGIKMKGDTKCQES